MDRSTRLQKWTLLTFTLLVSLTARLCLTQQTRFVYNGPDECDIDTCDCSLQPLKAKDESGIIVEQLPVYHCTAPSEYSESTTTFLVPTPMKDVIYDVQKGWDEVTRRTKASTEYIEETLKEPRPFKKMYNDAGDTILDLTTNSFQKFISPLKRAVDNSIPVLQEIWISSRMFMHDLIENVEEGVGKIREK